MKIIILAAGKGSRLYPLTKDRPKCLVKYKNKPILDYQLEIFKKNKLKKIYLVSGYKSNKIKRKKLNIVKNREYKNTNMLYSLFKLEKFFDGKEDILISYGDIIYKENVLKKIIKSKNDFATIVDKDWLSYWKKRMPNPILDAESLMLDKKDNIIDIGRKVKSLKKINGQYIGLTKISKKKTKDFLNIWKKLRENKKNLNKINNLYVTDFFRILIKKKFKLKAIFIKRNWLEFDTKEDLKFNY